MVSINLLRVCTSIYLNVNAIFFYIYNTIRRSCAFGYFRIASGHYGRAFVRAYVRTSLLIVYNKRQSKPEPQYIYLFNSTLKKKDFYNHVSSTNFWTTSGVLDEKKLIRIINYDEITVKLKV